MAVLKIAQMGHPALRQIAEELPPELVDSPALRKLLADMRETLVDYDGAGLAATQVHIPLRVVICDFSDGEKVLINPRLQFMTDEVIRSYEGCLSIPGIRAAVDRCASVRVQAIGEQGEALDFVAEDWNAIVAQHECDHLDGVLFIDRCDSTTLAFLEEYRRWGPLDPEFQVDPEDQDPEDSDTAVSEESD
jgi:peptide deformylase